MPLRVLREKINLFLYSSKERNLTILQYLSFIVSLGAVITLIYYYGFDLAVEKKQVILGVIRGTFVFYILSYLFRIVYAFDPLQYIKSTWFEGLLMVILLLDLIARIANIPIFETVMNYFGIANFKDYYIVFTQVYLLLIVGLDIGQVMTRLPKLNIEPSSMFIMSFLLLVLCGAGLLMLPEMSQSGVGMPFIDAIFTSVSASCVTGLIVVDTATYFTTKGQFIIMLLFQVGGLSIISFATFFALLSGSGVGIKHQSYLKDVLSAESLRSSKGMITRIVGVTISIEIVGSFLVYFLIGGEEYFESNGDRIFYSVFHTISAFNNAGFSLFSDGLYQGVTRHNYVLHLVIALLIFLGSLGFPVIRDLFGVNSLRERMRLPWKQIKLGTKIALYSSLALIVTGAVAFFILERNNTMDEMLFAEKVITSVFQSVTARTAGFNTVDFSVIGTPMLIIFIFLMFIGASPGSTGGGIKTTTFTLLIFSAWATIRGKRNLEMGNYFVTSELLNRAFTIAFFASAAVFLGVFILTITDPEKPIMQLVFEQVSAFATVGLSTGITPFMSQEGKIVLMISMFVGRVGILTLAFSLSKRVATSNYKYPNAHIMVG